MKQAPHLFAVMGGSCSIEPWRPASKDSFNKSRAAICGTAIGSMSPVESLLGKDPLAVDAKLIAKYGIAVSESTRARRKKAGQANLQYLRFERFFVVLATKGTHRFYDGRICSNP